MGNTCCNYAKSKDQHAVDFNGKPIKQDPLKLNELLEEAKKKEDKIVKL